MHRIYCPLFFAAVLWTGCGEQPTPEPTTTSAPELAEQSTPAQTASELFSTGRDLQNRAHFGRAEEVYLQTLALEPYNAQYHYYLGAVLH